MKLTRYAVSLVIFAGFAGPWRGALSCSVPVFRYALERWEAEPLRVVVFHRQVLDDAASAFVKALNGAAEGEEQRANVRAVTVSLDQGIPEEFRKLWTLVQTDDLPWAVVLYADDRPPPWACKPTGDNARRILESAARTSISRYIMSGASAVWVLLETGDRQKDDKARSFLTATLANLEKRLRLPDVLPEDRERNMSAHGPELRIWFPVLNLARSDAARRTSDAGEEFFVRLLCGIEQGVPATEPVVVPIYGRGRALCAFHGELLNADEIYGACAFLTGMCSCQIKAMNPGTDLLFSARWHTFLLGEAEVAHAIPDLIGTQKPEAAPQMPMPRSYADRSPAPEATDGSGKRILAPLLLVTGACLLVVLTASLMFWRGRRRQEKRQVL